MIKPKPPGSERLYRITPEMEQRRRQAIRDAAKRMREGDGFLYLAEVIGRDMIKIGYTLDLDNRMKTLQHDYGIKGRLLGSMSATIFQEKALHRRLKKFRTGHCGSWEFYHRAVLLHPAIPLELMGAA